MSDRNPTSVAPLLIAAIVVSFVAFLAWSGRQASVGGTDVTDPDYYSKGLRYNTTLIERRAASVIGWQVEPALDGRHLFLVLRDKTGHPVSGAAGTLLLTEPGSADARQLPLAEQSPGRYAAVLPANLGGKRVVRLEFERDGARISRQVLINLPIIRERPENE